MTVALRCPYGVLDDSRRRATDAELVDDAPRQIGGRRADEPDDRGGQNDERKHREERVERDRRCGLVPAQERVPLDEEQQPFQPGMPLGVPVESGSDVELRHASTLGLGGEDFAHSRASDNAPAVDDLLDPGG